MRRKDLLHIGQCRLDMLGCNGVSSGVSKALRIGEREVFTIDEQPVEFPLGETGQE
jgi:hypothetical protein